MVQEQLTIHEVEWEVVESPAQNRGADLVVESLERGVGVIVAAALPAESRNALEENVDNDSESRAPPHDGVAHQVDLAVILAPEVDTALEEGPRVGTRIPGMRLDQAGVGLPHNLLKLPELAKEARVTVVHLLDIVAGELRVLVVLDIPQAVGKGTSLRASDLLLLRGPLRELHLVREEYTASHDVNQSELGLDSAETLLGGGAEGLLLDNLNLEQVVGVALEALVAVSGHLVLPISLRHRGSDVVGMKATECGSVVKANDITILDKDRLGKVVPGLSSVDLLAVDSKRLGLVLKEPKVVLVLMGIESDLLLFATGGVHEGVRVQVAALCVGVSDADTATKSDVGGHILHTLGVEGRLELGAHEAVAVTRVDQAEEVDGKHGHVEADRNNDEGEGASHEVLGPDARRNVLGVSKENPELDEGQASNPGNGEQTDPFDADSGTQTQASHQEPEPPAQLESFLGSLFMLIREGLEREGGEGGCDHERGVEENETSLGKKAVFCVGCWLLIRSCVRHFALTEDDQTGSHQSRSGAAPGGLESQKHEGSEQDTADGREHAHGDVGNAGLEVILANVLEVEVAVETSQPTGESDEHFGQRRVDIHEEFALDVFRSEATKTVGGGRQ